MLCNVENIVSQMSYVGIFPMTVSTYWEVTITILNDIPNQDTYFKKKLSFGSLRQYLRRVMEK